MATAAPRIKGQEVQVLVVENNQPLTTLADVRSFESEEMLEIIREGYLGETTDRRDMVYRGFSGRMELHLENSAYLQFRQRMVDKARRRTTGTRVNIKATLNFPGGNRVRLLLKDVSFGAMPLTVGNRTEYVTVSLTFEGESTQIM
jgi:hypothetical protein